MPLLLGLQAQREPEDCRAWAQSGPWIEPFPVAGIAAQRPVEVAEGAVLAHEAVLIANPGWRLAGELHLPLAALYVYPAGTPLRPQYVVSEQRQIDMCLPLVPPEIAPPPAPGNRGETGMLPCLADRDGDGRYEQVDLYDTDFSMHSPQVRLARSVTLPALAQVADDPEGLDWTRYHYHRRIQSSAVEGDSVRLMVQHGMHEMARRRESGTYVDGPGGAHFYRPPALAPPPDPAGEPVAYGLVPGETRTARLIDGTLIKVGGLRFLVARRGAGWTMTPLASRFPRWIRFGCGGRSIRVGVEG